MTIEQLPETSKVTTHGVVGLCLLGIATLSGCATITRGTTDVLVIETEPPGAAVQISSGNSCKTPCSVELKRKHDYHLKIEKAGYEPVETDVMSQVVGAGAAGMAGNVLLGGLIGAGVDVATGATKSLQPNPVHVKLEPMAPAPRSTEPVQAVAVTTNPIATQSLPADAATLTAGAPVESICEQSERVDRAICRGKISMAMSEDEVVTALGAPSARSADDHVLRYDNRYLKFDEHSRLAEVTIVPAS